jgi:endonuclease/exonuclease/phosphatase family metal-dependent hydrolase
MIVAGIVSADEGPGQPAALGEPAAASVRLPEHSRRLDPVLDQPRVALAEMRAEAKAERIAELRAKREAARRAAEAAERKARLAAERKAAREERRAEREASTAPFDFKIGSFNVLGSQHTAPGGDRQKFPPASVRTPAAANLVAKHGVDVLGTQELQADQLRGLQARTGMSAYPGFGWGEAETDNSILWDPGMFELVSGSRFTINFMGRPRPQPIVRLRHLATGRELYVVNTHPSAGEGQYAAERRNGQSVLVGIVNDLRASGLPVLVTGDMNDREAFYCNVVPAAGLTAPNGGSYSGGCQPPPQPLPVDWVVGSQVSWSAYWRDTTPVDQRISDHFFISAAAHVG